MPDATEPEPPRTTAPDPMTCVPTLDMDQLLSSALMPEGETPPMPANPVFGNDPLAFLALDPSIPPGPVPGPATNATTATSRPGPAYRSRAPTSIFITSPTQRAQAQKREIAKMDPEKVKEAFRSCEALLADPIRLASLADGGASVRARHVLLLSRVQELDSLAAASSSSSSTSSQQMDTDRAVPSTAASETDTPLSNSPRSWSGGVRGFKQMLMDEQMRSEHSMSLRESIALQEEAFQQRKEAATRDALERMRVADGPKDPDAHDPNEVVLDFDELSDDEDDGDGPVDFGEPPDEEALWAMAEAAGFPRR